LRDDGYLDVVLRVQDEYKIPRSSTAAVVPVGIFGDVAVALQPKGPSRVHYQSGDTVPAGQSPPGIAEIMARVDTIGRRISVITAALEDQLVAGGAFRDVRQTIDAAQQLTLRLNRVATEQSQNLTATMASFRRAADALDPRVIDSTMRNFRETSANLAALSADLERTTQRADSILAALQSGRGTAGKHCNTDYAETHGWLSQQLGRRNRHEPGRTEETLKHPRDATKPAASLLVQ
jgi:ABC-type transporter Mla subunit MlaD